MFTDERDAFKMFTDGRDAFKSSLMGGMLSRVISSRYSGLFMPEIVSGSVFICVGRMFEDLQMEDRGGPPHQPNRSDCALVQSPQHGYTQMTQGAYYIDWRCVK